MDFCLNVKSEVCKRMTQARAKMKKGCGPKRERHKKLRSLNPDIDASRNVVLSADRLSHIGRGGRGRFWTSPKILLRGLFLLSLCHSTTKTGHAVWAESMRAGKKTPIACSTSQICVCKQFLLHATCSGMQHRCETSKFEPNGSSGFRSERHTQPQLGFPPARVR